MVEPTFAFLEKKLRVYPIAFYHSTLLNGGRREIISKSNIYENFYQVEWKKIGYL